MLCDYSFLINLRKGRINMLNMNQAAEIILFMAEKKKLRDVDIVVERNESLDL